MHVYLGVVEVKNAECREASSDIRAAKNCPNRVLEDQRLDAASPRRMWREMDAVDCIVADRNLSLHFAVDSLQIQHSRGADKAFGCIRPGPSEMSAERVVHDLAASAQISSRLAHRSACLVHGRARRGHPRHYCRANKACVPGTSSGTHEVWMIRLGGEPRDADASAKFFALTGNL